jgi:CRISPR-associated RAMP protein (TIGR02581 family)
MFDVFKNRLEISGILTTVTALRISQGRSTEPIGSDLPVVKDSLGRPFIPGASFKGALRSRLESFLRGVLGNNRKLVANPANEDEWSLTRHEIAAIKSLDFQRLLILNLARQQEQFQSFSLEELIQQIREGQIEIEQLTTQAEFEELKKTHIYDSALTQSVLQNTDLISSLFGSPWLSSKFQVRDLTVLPDAWFGQYQERDGVSIDRDTETAAEGKLYDFQVVPAGTPFEFKAVVENAEDWELGLLMIGLHQFENEMIPLGGGRSRGLGVVKLQLDEMIWVNPSNPQELMDYLKHLVDGQLQPYVKSSPEIETLKHQWTTELLSQLPRLAARETTHA